MRLPHPIFLSILIVLTTLSSCTTFRAVQNSGVLNTMAIELDDDNVTYERLESKFNRRTFGGFLKGAENTNIVEATVIHNNNGSKTRATMNFFGAPGLQLTSLLTLSFGYYRGFLSDWFQSRDAEEEQIFDPYVKVLSAFAAAALGLITNENLWRPFNGSRIEREAFNSTMKQNPDADFYSFPYASFEIKPGLMGTNWSGTQRIVAGNITDELFESRDKLIELDSDQSADYNESSQESRRDSEIETSIEVQESEPLVPTVRGKEIKVGSTGKYKYSRNDLRSFQVLEILNFKGGDKFKVRVFIENATDTYTTTFKASNKSLIFD